MTISILHAICLAGIFTGTNAKRNLEIQSLGDFTASMVPDSRGKCVTLVTGNQGGDADSIITALTYAYLLHIDIYEDFLAGTQPVSYMKFMREDMPMRAETEKILEYSGVNSSDLLFNDDPCVKDILSNMTQLVLTDHNSNDVLELYPHGDIVIQIFDHHTDLGDHPQVEGENRVIAFDEIAKKATAASACTVICEQYLKHPLGMEILALNDAAVALALLSVILIDGSNKEVSEGGKLTHRDMECIHVLQNITNMTDASSTALYEELNAAKKNATLWEAQSAAQILRYDFKSFNSTDDEKSVGISSCPVSLEDLSQKDDWITSLASRASKYDLYIVMTKMTKEDGSKGKEILFSSCDENLVSDAAEFFMSYDDPSLQLESIEVSPVPDFSKAFDQNNTSPGRKQIGPISQEFLDTISNSPDCVVGKS